MLKMHECTARRSIRNFKISSAHKKAKIGLAVILAGIVFSVLAFGQQSQREYIYLNGKAISTETSWSGCSYSISPFSTSIAATSGTGTISVSSAAGCSWGASSNAGWITVTSGSSGSGNGTVGYSVASNSGSPRSGTITISGQTFTINQAGGCTYSISPASTSIAATGGTGYVSVSSAGGCSWGASSNAGWITITAGSSGSGNGTVSYSVASNTCNARSGTITISGQTFTINQASGCTYGLNPANAYYSTDGSTGNSFTVTTASACSWAAASNSGWITITVGSSGTGNGTVTYSVAANTADARDGTISVGNSIHYVSQDAYSTCDLECANACMAQNYPYEYCALMCGCQ